MLPRSGDVILLNPAAEIDATGVPFIIGNCTLDFSGMTATTALTARGTRTLIASGLTPSRGAVQITVDIGLSLQRGQTLFFVSGEPIPYAGRTSYSRGERNYVADYDAATGLLTLVSPLLYTYRSGTHSQSYSSVAYDIHFDGCSVYAVTENHLTLGEGLTIIGPETGGTGLDAVMCRLTSRAAFERWGVAGLSVTASHADIRGRVFSGWYSGSGNSYGVVVGDLSRATVVGADIFGGRHAFASGGGGEFTRSEAGSTMETAGVSDAGAAPLTLPSVIHLLGGEYRNTSEQEVGAVDAHGIVEELILTGATVHGGVQGSARKTRVSGCTVYHRNFPGAYLTQGVGEYAPAGEEYSWGDLEVSDTTIETTGLSDLACVQVMAGVFRRLCLSNVTIRGNFELSGVSATDQYRTPFYIDSAAEIKELDVDIVVESSGDPRWMSLYVKHAPRRFRVRGNTCLNIAGTGADRIELDVDLDLAGFQQDFYGVQVTGVSDLVAVRGRVVNAPWSGLNLDAPRLIVEGDLSNNGRLWEAAESNALRAGAYLTGDEMVIRARMRDTQATPTQALAFSAFARSGTAVVDLIDCDFRGVVDETGTPLNVLGYGLDTGVTIRRQRGVILQDGTAAADQFVAGGVSQRGFVTGTATSDLPNKAAGATHNVNVLVPEAEADWIFFYSIVDQGTGTGTAYNEADWTVDVYWLSSGVYRFDLTNTSGGAVDLRNTKFTIAAVPS